MACRLAGKGESSKVGRGSARGDDHHDQRISCRWQTGSRAGYRWFEDADETDLRLENILPGNRRDQGTVTTQEPHDRGLVEDRAAQLDTAKIAKISPSPSEMVVVDADMIGDVADGSVVDGAGDDLGNVAPATRDAAAEEVVEQPKDEEGWPLKPSEKDEDDVGGPINR